ncbi:DNA-binding response regulator [Alteribacter lacisalsi]|uniref:Heme response regulator HssR n=1 Tax=Alteribacter lacisalsi TaxID=2045244 RepID=A0A2W0H3N0_9BACI|nr:response regulator transcription factor [Alteribacter lacisalsi]PYZ96434.1 DNA-binding response regulator [Alteribacter lacisalsi]
MRKPAILVVDDDSHIRRLMKVYLESSGYTVTEAADGQQALRLLEQERVDLAVVDVMMPYADGYAVTEEIRSWLEIPVILVTAKGESKDKIKGFEAGTDDYLVKPFDPVELVLRVKALLKRYKSETSRIIHAGSLLIDLEQFTATADGKTAELKRKESELLGMLAGSAGKILTRAQLIEKIWGYDYEGDERTVDVHVKRVREKLARIDGPKIETVRGLGYRLEKPDD